VTGTGTETKPAKVISKHIEDELWKTGVLNSNIPTGLQNAVSYYLGKVCCLRGRRAEKIETISVQAIL